MLIAVLPTKGQVQFQEVGDEVGHLQEKVGGYLEMCGLANESCKFTAYCNEEGLITMLPVNELAITVLPKLGIRLLYQPRGTVILLSNDDTGLDHERQEAVKRAV